MPIYEFQCPKCGSTVERLIRNFKEDTPICRGKSLKKEDEHEPVVMKKIISTVGKPIIN